MVTPPSQRLNSIRSIPSTARAFAAITVDGNVFTWGAVSDGGDSSAVQQQLHDMSSISSACSAFAAVEADGSVVTWGDERRGHEGAAFTLPLTFDDIGHETLYRFP